MRWCAAVKIGQLSTSQTDDTLQNTQAGAAHAPDCRTGEVVLLGVRRSKIQQQQPGWRVWLALGGPVVQCGGWHSPLWYLLAHRHWTENLKPDDRWALTEKGGDPDPALPSRRTANHSTSHTPQRHQAALHHTRRLCYAAGHLLVSSQTLRDAAEASQILAAA